MDRVALQQSGIGSPLPLHHALPAWPMQRNLVDTALASFSELCQEGPFACTRHLLNLSLPSTFSLLSSYVLAAITMPLSRNVSWQNIRNSSRQQTPADSSSSNTDESPLQSSQEGLRNSDTSNTISGTSATSLQVPSATAVDASRSAQQASQPLAYLRVQVLKATNLIPKDRNGKADPYAVVSLPALAALSSKSNQNSDRYRKKTAAISKTLEPEWKNEVWDFPITAEWLGPDGFFEEDDSGNIGEDIETSPPPEDEVVGADDASEAMAALDLQPKDKESASAGQFGVPTISVAASDKPARPSSSRRHLSSTAIKVLSTSAKGGS